MRVDIGRKRALIFSSGKTLGKKPGQNLRLGEVGALRIFAVKQGCGYPDAVRNTHCACDEILHHGISFQSIGYTNNTNNIIFSTKKTAPSRSRRPFFVAKGKESSTQEPESTNP